LVELHVGDAIHEQAAGAVFALEDRDPVTGAIELGGGAEAGGAGTDNGNLPARAALRRLGDNPAFLPPAVDDGDLEILDRDRRRVDAEDTGTLAGGGTHPAREVREIVGLVESFEGLLPETAIDEIVPLRDEIVDRTSGGHAREEGAGVAEGNAAIHASGGLRAEAFLRHGMVELVPVPDPLKGGTIEREFAKVLDEAGGFTHACAVCAGQS